MRLGSSKEEQKCPTDLPTSPSGSTRSAEKRLRINGGRTRTRTLDPLIKSQLPKFTRLVFINAPRVESARSRLRLSRSTLVAALERIADDAAYGHKLWPHRFD